MDTLPEALQALDQYRQFIIFQYVPLEDGRTDKVPVDWRSGAPHSAHDPEIWLSFAEAREQATRWGFDVGFTITEQDPFFFLDVDACLTLDGQWTEIANELCKRFSGAAVEVSNSMRGLHILGKGRAPAVSKTKCKDAGGEELFCLFLHGRFCALTGTSAIGNVALDHTQALGQLCADYLSQSEVATVADWSNGPVDEWDGPTDDDALIEKMLASQSTKAVLGTSCPIRCLWEADATVLARHYPRPDGTYNASDADEALCYHLAFWTGKDCERINTLFERSALYREEKWGRREDYAQGTVLKAVAQCSGVYNANYGKEPPAEGEEGRRAYAFSTVEDQKALFTGCFYIRDRHRIMVPDGAFLRPEQFRAVYGGYVFYMDSANTVTTKSAWEVFTESRAVFFPKVHSSAFRPELAPGEIIEEEGRTIVNNYVPVPVPCAEGDITPFTELIVKLLPIERDRSIITSYMAAVVQYPGVKFHWCPVLQGVEGNGKSLLMTAVSRAVGVRYTHKPPAKDIGNVFNAWIDGKLFIQVEDIRLARQAEVMEALKPLITDDRVPLTPKGIDQVTGDNRANFMMGSNWKDAVAKTVGDRRYCIFYTAQQSLADIISAGMDGSYFPSLYGWFNHGGSAIITHYLRNYAIPEELNPATSCHRAPITSSTAEAIHYNRTEFEQEILEAVGDGRVGFMGGFISSIKLNEFLIERGLAKKYPRNARVRMLEDMGYNTHPALNQGRLAKDSPIDRGKPRLYILAGNPAIEMKQPILIWSHYLKCQNYVVTGVDTSANSA